MQSLRRLCPSAQHASWHPRALLPNGMPGQAHLCQASSKDEHKSDSFSSQLRKGFQPRKSKPPSAGVAQNSASNQVVLGNLTDEAWREVDKQVNQYPGYRTFTAIGSGDDFKDSMVKAVEAVVGQIHVECVQQRPSSKGSYTSVKVGPVIVHSPEQVIAIFANMKQDPRLKWYM